MNLLKDSTTLVPRQYPTIAKMISLLTNLESIAQMIVEQQPMTSVMQLFWLAMDHKMVLNTGELRILGGLHGEKKDISKLNEE